MVLFGFFSLVLVLVYWINRAVVLFDQLIADGQSAWVFLEFTALSLPNVIRLVLPLSAFAATLYVTNRMSSESELTVVQATGYSARRLARPVVYFGLIVALMMSVLTHFLVPLSISRLENREIEINQNITARLLTEGQFVDAADGVTVYIREITPEGELLDVFLSDTRPANETITYTARRSFLVRTETGPQLVMIDGLAQTWDRDSGRLFTTTFTDFAYDIGAFIQVEPKTERGMKELPTLALMFPTPAIRAETGEDTGTLLQEGHNRFGQALLATVAALIGFATLLVGGFSRFGLWRQMISAVFLLILIKALESVAADLVQGDPDLWPLVYMPSGVGFALAMAMLTLVDRPRLLRRRGRAA